MYKYLSGKKGGIAHLVTKAKLLSHLNQEFLKYVPTPVNQHVELANIQGVLLNVIADSPAWAAKFRYMSQQILPTLRKNIKYFQHVREISVSTKPKLYNNSESRKLNKRIVSQSAKSCLEEMASGLENGQLKTSLFRLASRHKDNK